VTLAKRLLEQAKLRKDREMADSLTIRVDMLGREAAQVCEWLDAMTDLVEPEPSDSPSGLQKMPGSR
jgi:hypothetical protein